MRCIAYTARERQIKRGQCAGNDWTGQKRRLREEWEHWQMIQSWKERKKIKIWKVGYMQRTREPTSNINHARRQSGGYIKIVTMLENMTISCKNSESPSENWSQFVATTNNQVHNKTRGSSTTRWQE